MLICFICHAGAYKLVFMAGVTTITTHPKMKKANKEIFPEEVQKQKIKKRNVYIISNYKIFNVLT